MNFSSNPLKTTDPSDIHSNFAPLNAVLADIRDLGIGSIVCLGDVVGYASGAINRRLRCDFFEGVVMKRGNSPYPVQLRSDTEECLAIIIIVVVS